MHVPLTLNGTMSRFTCRKPTFAEVSDPEGAGVKVVHMTSDAPWDAQTEGPQELEETLRSALQQHMTHPFDSSTRRLSGLQVRGQESEVDFSVPLEPSDLGPSQLDPGGNAPGEVLGSGKLEPSYLGPSQLDPGGNAPVEVLGSGRIDVPIDPVGQVDEPVGQVIGSVVDDGAQVTLKSLQIEQEHHAALEVDRYAEVLLSELGVSEGTALISLYTGWS